MHLLQHGQPGRTRLMSYLESPNDCSLTPLSLQDLLLLIFSPVGTCFFLGFPFQKVSFTTCFHIVSIHVSPFPRLKGTFSWEVQPYHFPEMARKQLVGMEKKRSRQQDELRKHHITKKDIKAHRQEKKHTQKTQE